MSFDPPVNDPVPEPSPSSTVTGTLVMLALCVIVGLVAIVVLLGA